MWAGDMVTPGVLVLLLGGLSGERSVRGGGGDSITVSCGTKKVELHTRKDGRPPDKTHHARMIYDAQVEKGAW